MSDLIAYGRACTALRSAERAAEGFTSGIRVANLKMPRKAHTDALLKLAD